MAKVVFSLEIYCQERTLTPLVYLYKGDQILGIKNSQRWPDRPRFWVSNHAVLRFDAQFLGLSAF